MNNLTGNFSEDMRKYIVTVPALHTTAAGARITLPPVTFVFDTSSNVTVANVVAALQQYVAEHKVAHYSADEAYICKWLAKHVDLGYELTYAFERALRSMRSSCRTLGRYLSENGGMNLSRDALNGLRLKWARHCITALHSLPSLRSKEMNEKHNYNLLRPVIFDDLKIGEVLQAYSGLPPTVAYKAPTFAVLKFEDGSEGCYEIYKLETSYKLVPLCWVENKPVYPGDGPLYYKHDPAWVYNKEGVFALSIRDDELHFHGGTVFPISDVTWTKPEQRRVPSFQVEDQDVFPGNTVYYYGINKDNWGEAHKVEENGRVVWKFTGSVTSVYSCEGGTEAFRLKPQLVIGDRLVPMPERDPLEEGEGYFTPSLYNSKAVGYNTWRDTTHDRMCLKAGLMHLNKEAAIAHGEALVALSKKKD